jgi:hypothetical protein
VILPDWFPVTNDEAIAFLERIRFMSQFIVPFITDEHFCNGACDRRMALIGGWADVGAEMRWPYRSIPADHADRIRREARDLIPEFLTASFDISRRSPP